jgi:hypothetical protein
MAIGLEGHIICHDRQLSPYPEKCQLSFRYLARASVGRKISDAGVGNARLPARMAGGLHAKKAGYGLTLCGGDFQNFFLVRMILCRDGEIVW